MDQHTFTVPLYILILGIPFSNAKGGPCKDFQPCLAYTNEQTNTFVCTNASEYREKFLSLSVKRPADPNLNWTAEYEQLGEKYCETGVPCVPLDPTIAQGQANLVHYIKYYSLTDTMIVCNSQDKSKRCPNGAICRYDVDDESGKHICPFPDPNYGVTELGRYLNYTNPYTHSDTWKDFLKYVGENYCSSGTCVRTIPKHEDDITTICVDPTEPNYDPWDVKCENNRICFLACPKASFQNAALVRALFKPDFFGLHWRNDHGKGDCSPIYHEKCSLSDEERELLDTRLEYLGEHYCKSGRCGYTYEQTLEYLIPICVDENWIPPDESRAENVLKNCQLIVIAFLLTKIIALYFE